MFDRRVLTSALPDFEFLAGFVFLVRVIAVRWFSLFTAGMMGKLRHASRSNLVREGFSSDLIGTKLNILKGYLRKFVFTTTIVTM